MKTLLLFILFPVSLLAQAPFKGGINDGHAMTERKGITVQSINEVLLKSTSLYPNPVSAGEQIKISSAVKEIQDLKLYSLEGKLILTMQVNNGSLINTGTLSEGVYIAIIQGFHSRSIHRLIIR